MTLGDFFGSLPFAPDPFQVQAAAAVEQGGSVVVTAPTGAGKTLVAEAAVHLALGRGRRAFYTTPLKALSNQKYADFVAVYGSERVGLLTGDNSINGDAPVVVMTTEVLRNMIYAESEALHDLDIVVLDEVHYLQDPFRGAVWEEVIIHAPLQVQLVCLSATVANPEEFTGWVRSRRGRTELVEEKTRPVPLESTYLVKDLAAAEPLRLFPMFERDRPNQAVVRLLSGRGRGRRRRFVTPRRGEVVELLNARGMLPAIYFIFSRAGCEAAAERLAAETRLTTPEEREEILAAAEEHTEHLADGDLAVLGYDRWVEALQSGVAAHHAGMVPAFKETVEILFLRGLIRVVFATETLALGINMPAKTVVLESMSKYSGEGHEILQPGDYTQLTGRAGRRGIDRRGYGVALYSPYVAFDRVAGIASAGTHPLRSSFRPTYNMAVNLVANYGRERALELLNASFAQYQRRGMEATLQHTVQRSERQLEEYRAAASCERGDVWEYLALVDSADRGGRRRTVHRFVAGLRAGDVLDVPGGGREGRYVLLQRRRWQSDDPRLVMLSTSGKLSRWRLDDLVAGSARLGAVVLPKPFRPRERRFQQQVLRRLRSFRPQTEETLLWEPAAASAGHPVASCPDASRHLRWGRAARRLERQVERQRSELRRAGVGLLAEFEAILDLLESWGYLRGWSVTAPGERLRFVYNELDLLLAEAVERGMLSGLTAPELAALASVFVYEPRGEEEVATWPTADLADRWKAVLELWSELRADEASRRISETPAPEAGFAALVYEWAAGGDLEDLIEDEGMAPGDFVRTCRQVLDLLRQVRDAAPELGAVAGVALGAVDRGVVAAGGAI